jgi:hypothetical protein
MPGCILKVALDVTVGGWASRIGRMRAADVRRKTVRFETGWEDPNYDMSF